MKKRVIMIVAILCVCIVGVAIAAKCTHPSHYTGNNRTYWTSINNVQHELVSAYDYICNSCGKAYNTVKIFTGTKGNHNFQPATPQRINDHLYYEFDRCTVCGKIINAHYTSR